MLCELILKSETKTQLKVFVVPLNNIEAMEPERNACLRSHDKAPALLPTLGSGSGTMHLTQRGAKGIAEGRRGEERVFFLRVPLRDPSRPLRLNGTPRCWVSAQRQVADLAFPFAWQAALRDQKQVVEVRRNHSMRSVAGGAAGKKAIPDSLRVEAPFIGNGKGKAESGRGLRASLSCGQVGP